MLTLLIPCYTVMTPIGMMQSVLHCVDLAESLLCGPDPNWYDAMYFAVLTLLNPCYTVLTPIGMMHSVFHCVDLAESFLYGPDPIWFYAIRISLC